MRPVTTGRIVHAQIFAGPAGTGKSEAARYIAQALSCSASGNRPCGVCPSCLRFKDGNAPELTELRPDKKNVIKVDTVRDMLKELALRPAGKVRCVIIHDADRMNDNAQNALLKTLEEAPDYAVFFLLTQRYTALLPTIRSRCVLMRFSEMSLRDTADCLVQNGISPEKASVYAALSFGSAGKALQISEDEEYQSALTKLTELFGGFASKRDIPTLSPKLAYFKANPVLMLEILEESASELMRGEVVNPVAAALSRHGHDGLKLMRAVLTCRKRLNGNVNYQYAAEMMLYDLTAAANI